MAESGSTTVSRRSTRIMDEEELIEVGHLSRGVYDSRGSSGDELEKDKQQRDSRSSSLGTSCSSSIDGRLMPMVDLGRELFGIMPSTIEEMGTEVNKSLQAARASSRTKADGRPVNFGVVLPGAIYRSSFPMDGDYQFLGGLGLKTILSLVKKGFPIEFQDFVKGNGIRHCIIDMQGTKKVDIPEIMMQSIMKIVLDQDNYPLLIHCNHGKHRTGCAVAVLRHVTGWNVDAIIEEYSGFAEPKIRDCDLKYIREYQVSSLQGLFTTKKLPKPPARNRAKMAQLLVYTALVLSIWFITAYFW